LDYATDFDPNVTIVHIKNCFKLFKMNKTVKMLLIIHKLRKKKPSYINWKTFNAKQTNIHMPKVLHILKKINKTILIGLKKQIKIQENILMYTSYKNNIQNNTPTSNSINKQIKYNSIFRIEKNNNTNTKNSIQNMHNNKDILLNSSTQYTIYMLLLNIYINFKTTTITTVALPRKRTAYTVLKSPHADKKAREQYMKELFNVRISLQNYIAVLQYMNSTVLSYTKAFMHSYKYNAFYVNTI